MSRRPKLKVGDLYHIKSFLEWDFDGYHNEEYLAKALIVGEQESSNDAIRVQFQIIASTQDDIPSSDLQYDYTTASYPWKKSWVIESSTWRNRPGRIVVQKFNTKKLPLYLNWGYGTDFIRGMLKGTYA
jgi:hypothetical protein